MLIKRKEMDMANKRLKRLEDRNAQLQTKLANKDEVIAEIMASRHLVHQYLRHVLLPVQHIGRLQPLHRPLGNTRVDD